MNKFRVLGGALALLMASGQALADGKQLFNQHCSSCHGAEGAGIDGVAPPLRNPSLWQRLGEQAPTYLTGVWAGGLSGSLEVDGQTYRGLVMPPQTQIPAADLEQVSGYLLHDLNGAKQRVERAQIEAARQAPLSHQQLRALRKGV